MRPFDIDAVRQDFPILSRTVHDRADRAGKPLVYLDSAASGQKPLCVVEAMSRFMLHDYANVHRGVHTLSQLATDAYELVRDKAAGFIHAAHRDEIIFTRNSTAAINGLALSLERANYFKAGDEVILSHMEHHANIVPWQLVRERTGIVLRVVPVDDIGCLDMDAYAALLGPKTKLVAITHASNVLGTLTPAAEIVRLAHEKGVPVLLDGSQAVVHGPVDVQALDVDFYVFTGHKIYGPTGIGVLYGKRARLKDLPPWEGGGDMIASVSFEKTTFAEPPARFEAGTPAIVEAVGLGAAIDYLSSFDWAAIQQHEQALLATATQGLQALSGVRILGTAPHKVGVLSFVLEGVHPHDMGSLLDRAGIALRVGQHCAEPLLARYNLFSCARASFGLYNTPEEIRFFIEAVAETKKFFGV